MEIRYSGNGFDLRSFILRSSARLQGKKVVILKSGIQDCVNVLLNSNTKGSFIESMIASPAWRPILSLESTDGEVWASLITKFRPMFAKIGWEEKLPAILTGNLEELGRELRSDDSKVIDAEAISRLVLKVFYELVFREKIGKKDEDLFYQASIEWRKEIALKGVGDPSVKREFWDRLTRLLAETYGAQMPADEQGRVVFVSIFAQPFFISPQINFADIFASIGHIFDQNPQLLSAAREKTDGQQYQYLRGIIFESMRLYHPFPVLERELTKELQIKGVAHAAGTQVFIMLDEFEQSRVVDPESWVNGKNSFAPLLFGVGPRSCPGRQLAEKLMPELLKGFLAFPVERFQPQQNLLYSGRINDKKQSMAETFYQLKAMMKYLWKCFKIGVEDMEPKVVLITGGSSGIGKECAEHLSRMGLTVYGTSRKVDQRPKEFKLVEMDITSDESINKAIEGILKETGRIDVLINNAGIGYAGSVEDTSLDEARAQMETNFFGPLRVIKNVLPHMKKRKFGHIINMSSIGGIVSLPYQSIYCSSKFAIEGLTESLRLEVKNYNIKISLVEPGDFKTSFTKNRIIVKGAGSESTYFPQMKKSLEIMERDEQNGPSPIFVAKKIEAIINSKNPRLRYTVGMPIQRLAVLLKKILPENIFEWLMRKNYQL